jgi:protoporphyrinogen/coproporphyrinogen III oxidase
MLRDHVADASPVWRHGDAPRRVVVGGGGIAGLSTAYHLQEGARSAGLPIECTLIEGSTRLGGKICTREEQGFVVEGGPDCFLTQKPWALELVRKLGLSDRLIGTNDASRKVHILWKSRLHRLPEGVLLIVPTRLRPFALSPLLSHLGKMRMGLDLLIPPRLDPRDESVASFVRRRLGQEALDKIAEPLMGGIHVSDPERQSLLATFPRFADIEKQHGSLIRGILAARRSRPTGHTPMPMFMTLRGGLGELVSALAGRLGDTRVLLGRRVTSLSGGQGDGYRMRLDDGTDLQADAVVLATPARDAAGLVVDIDTRLTARLRSIRYVSTATISFGYRRETFPHPLDGFGFVIPSKERRRITACTWTSTKFDHRAPADGVLLRCFLGGANDEAPALLPESEMVRLAKDELREIMGISVEPMLTQVHRWRDGHPQYDVGHLDRLAEIDRLRSDHPGLYLVGSSYRGVGLPDCIHDGALAAEQILRQVEPALAAAGATLRTSGAAG